MKLDELRRRIDEIDRQLVALLNARAEIALSIGEAKREQAGKIYDPLREQRVIENVLAANPGPFSAAAMREIYGAIIAASRTLQRPLRVAYLGPKATFTHQAAKSHFGSLAQFTSAKTIAEVFYLVEKGAADHGVVPIENSNEGMVSHTLDMFVDTDLKACAELSLPITQNLLANDELANISKVYSHSQAIAQTRDWLARHLPNAEIVEVTSTARAAEMASMEPRSAAIANELAAEVYGLRIVAPRIEDNPQNVTRFLVIGQEMAGRSGHDKTALLFSIKHRVGALHNVLQIFQQHGLNLTSIESRPSKRRAWEYLFFVDVQGHPEDENMVTALDSLSAECVYLKILGAWPSE